LASPDDLPDIREDPVVTDSIEEQNKALVRDALETLFNRRDFAAAEAFFSPSYIQHSAHIPPGRDGLFELVKSLPATHQREMGAIVAEGDMVMAHGRLWGYGDGRANRIAVDIMRIEHGLLVEHWDVIEDEASRGVSRSGLPSFGDRFPEDRRASPET
jgi:predicted SnoaL-like aldol condensation-catalyzing enzyme